MYKYLFNNKKYTAIFFALLPFRAACTVVITFLLANTIDCAMNQQLDKLPKYIIGFILYIIFDYLIDIANGYYKFNMIQSGTVALRSELFHKYINMKFEDYSAENTGTYFSTIETDVDTIRETFFFIIDTLSEILIMGVALIVVYVYSWQIGVFLTITTIVQALIPVIFDKPLDRAGQKYSQVHEKYTSVLREGLSGFLTAKIFYAEKNIEDKYKKILNKSEQCWKNREFKEEFITDCSYIFNKISYLGVFVFGSFLIMTGTLKLSIIVAIADIVSYISNPALYLVSDIARLKTASEPFRKIQKILCLPEEFDEIEEDCNISNYAVSLIDFTVKYNNERKLFKNINYNFERGKKYLITGESGCGKSTMLSMIAGIRENYAGEILIGDKNIKKIGRKTITSTLCYIDQDPFFFDDDIYTNITFGKNISEQEVTDTLKKVGLQKLLQSMDAGIKTNLCENANRISGGEKQRISIARALVEKTPILIFDEITSHLDEKNTKEIEKLILELEDVTVIMVSHNPTDVMINAADEVLVLDKNGLSV